MCQHPAELEFQPPRLSQVVGIQARDPVARRRLDPSVQGCRHSRPALAYDPHPAVELSERVGHLIRPVGRAVIHENDVEVGVRLRQHALDARLQGRRGVPERDHPGHGATRRRRAVDASRSSGGVATTWRTHGAEWNRVHSLPPKYESRTPSASPSIRTRPCSSHTTREQFRCNSSRL